MPALYLPPEVLTVIVSYVDSTTTLKSIARVSKAAHQTVLPFLFSDVSFLRTYGVKWPYKPDPEPEYGT